MMPSNFERQPPAALPEAQENRENEPLPIHIYAQEVRSFDPEKGKDSASDKTFYRWEGRLWEKNDKGEHVPGEPQFGVYPNIEASAGAVRNIFATRAVPERKTQRQPSYKFSVQPTDEIKQAREESLRKADNVMRVHVRGLNEIEAERFREELLKSKETSTPEPQQKLTSPLQRKEVAPPPVPARPIEQRQPAPESIQPELKQRLTEAARAAHQPESDAMMNPALRQLLVDVRQNYPMYLMHHIGPANILKKQIIKNIAR